MAFFCLADSRTALPSSISSGRETPPVDTFKPAASSVALASAGIESALAVDLAGFLSAALRGPIASPTSIAAIVPNKSILRMEWPHCMMDDNGKLNIVSLAPIAIDDKPGCTVADVLFCRTAPHAAVGFALAGASVFRRFSRYGGRMTPRSVMNAAIRPDGVTSKAGL